jgi:hypothetical protein
MNGEEVMGAASNLKVVGYLSDDIRIQFYILQAMASIAVNTERIAASLHRIDQTMHEVHLENLNS